MSNDLVSMVHDKRDCLKTAIRIHDEQSPPFTTFHTGYDSKT